MRRIVKNPQAKSDLKQIWHYIANHHGRQRADAFLRTLDEKIKKLVNTPLIGRKRDELMPDLRSFPIGDYVIFYIPLDHGIEVVRVLHGSRDIEYLFSAAGEGTMQ